VQDQSKSKKQMKVITKNIAIQLLGKIISKILYQYDTINDDENDQDLKNVIIHGHLNSMFSDVL
jgi:hypothetical protein